MASSLRTSSSQAKKSQQSPAPSSDHRQPTISQLFSSSQQKKSTVPLSPGNKRKRSSLSHPNCSSPSPAKPASTTNMYNFASKGSANGLIDLTGSPSPNSRSKHRRISVGAKVENAPVPGGPRKLAVKNFRTTAKSDSSQYVAKTIAQLDAALSAIFANQRPVLSNEELYRGSENVCKLGQASELAKMVTARCKDHVADGLKTPLLSIVDEEDAQVLKAVLDSWSVWMKQLTTIRAIFFYLDRSHLLQTQSPSIYDASIDLFRAHVFGHHALRKKVINGACELLLAERHGNAADASLFAAAVKMFHDLQVYTSDFEPKMLAASQTYIAEWSDRECTARELPDYITVSVNLMDAEMERCEEFNLDGTTRRALLALLENHLIERKQEELTNRDSVADILDMGTNVATENTAKLFSLLQRCRLGVKLIDPFSKWLDDTGTAIVFDEKDEDRMVMRLLEFKQKLDHIWRFAFNKHEELGHALRGTFETFMNKSKKSSSTWNTDNSKTGEMIAKYVDMLLNKGAKAIPTSLKAVHGVKSSKAFNRFEKEQEPDEDAELDEDTEVDNQLDQVLDLFRFVHGKAVFEAFYKKDLARRLLMSRSASYDAEKNMLARLKTECGAGFTHNLEQMFKDIELADEEAKAYKNRFSESYDRKAAGAIDLTVNVLSSAAWPSYPDVPVAIPIGVKKALDDYERFYHSKHSGRKLAWKHALAHCVVKANFPKGIKELVVSSFQAVILLLFNGRGENEHITYEDIKAESGLSDIETARTLQSLACAKFRPLTKHPRGRDINTTDTFTLNASFSQDKYRIKINTIQLKETKEENKETHVRVAADRQFETQATIVRILKQKKRITHQNLILEVIDKTKSRGVLQPAEIKKEIDKLIDKEYLERAEGNVYEYLA